MATDPPAASALPEIADLDPAFDLATFATERSATRPVGAQGPARVSPRPAPDRHLSTPGPEGAREACMW